MAGKVEDVDETKEYCNVAHIPKQTQIATRVFHISVRTPELTQFQAETRVIRS